MEELSLFYLTQVFRVYAVGLCVGVSTIALVNYFYIVSKGHLTPAERSMMHLVYTVLRIGMALVMISEFTTFLYNRHANNFIYWTDNPELLMRLTAFGVILANALAMQFRKISMWVGPAIAGGSWYTYAFFSVWLETETTYLPLFVGYLCWLALIIAALAGLRITLVRMTPNKRISISDQYQPNNIQEES